MTACGCRRSQSRHRSQSQSKVRFDFQTAGKGYATAIPRRHAPEFWIVHPPRKTEGAGNAGRSLHPQPRVRNETKHTSVVTTGSDGFNRHSPRNGFTAYFALSPVTRLV